MAAGADGFLRKTFRPGDLAAAVTRCLEPDAERARTGHGPVVDCRCVRPPRRSPWSPRTRRHPRGRRASASACSSSTTTPSFAWACARSSTSCRTSRSWATPPTAARAWPCARRLTPDVVLMDLLMPNMDGVTAIGRIKAELPETEIVTMTSFIEEEKVTSALEAGASGYVLKDAEAEEVAQAIRAAFAGEVHLDPAGRATARAADAGEEGAGRRSSRSRTARRTSSGCSGQGLSNKEIGARCSSPSGPPGPTSVEHPGQARARVAHAGRAVGRRAQARGAPGRLTGGRADPAHRPVS